MTLTEAKDSLIEQYRAAGQYPSPYEAVQVGVYSGRDVIEVHVNSKRLGLIPPESKPGVGYLGFEVVGYRGPSIFLSDSGVIP